MTLNPIAFTSSILFRTHNLSDRLSSLLQLSSYLSKLAISR